MIQIKAATLNDLPFLQEMIWEALMASPGFVRELGVENVRRHEKEYWKRWRDHPDPAFIAVDEDSELQKLGAIVLYSGKDAPSGKEYRIGVAVKEGARGKGIGKLLIGRALKFAKDEQAHKVNLYVDPNNIAAISLYKNMGFRITEERDHEITMEVNLRGLCKMFFEEVMPQCGSER